MANLEWTCEACTYVNGYSDFSSVCSMCGGSRDNYNRRLWDRHEEGVHHDPMLLTGTLTAVFALVGAFIGAVAGALGSQAVGMNMLYGSVLGSIVGAVFCVEVLEISLAFWFSDRSGMPSSSSMVDFIEGLLNGRFVREQVGLAMLTAYHWQASIADMSYENRYDIFEEGGSKGLSGACLEKLPWHYITKENKMDASGQNIGCTICLQDLQQGEIGRSLPLCFHTFHMSCLDKWLIRHGSCPVCRQDICHLL